jgi:hypothetical protein
MILQETRLIEVKNLGTFQKADMREAMSNRAKSVLREMITAEDAAPMMRLVLLDAGENCASVHTDRSVHIDRSMRAYVDRYRSPRI